MKDIFKKIIIDFKSDEELIEIKRNQNNFQKEFIFLVDEELKRRKIPENRYSDDVEKEDIFQEYNDDELKRRYINFLVEDNPKYLKLIEEELQKRQLLTREIIKARGAKFDEVSFNKKAQKPKIIALYLLAFLCLLISPGKIPFSLLFLLGLVLLGLVFVLQLLSRKEDSDGFKQYVYSSKTRIHATISLVLLILALLIRLRFLFLK